MKIKGLSRYDFDDSGGRFRVINRKGVELRMVGGYYHLCSDNGRRSTFSIQALRLLLAHPGTDAGDVRGTLRSLPPPGVSGGVTPKGLSGYVVYEKDGSVRVWSRRRQKEVTPARPLYPQFHLIRDDGCQQLFSVGCLRYLMNHPEADACSLDLRKMRIKFRDDGTPVDLYEGPRSRMYIVFRDIDDVQRTVDIMRDVYQGNTDTVMAFLAEFRNTAVYTVANLLGLSPNTVRMHLEEAEEDFLGQLRNANVERIMPLFAWLCKCLRCACRRSLKKIRIDAGWDMGRDMDNAAYQPECEI